MIGAVSSENAYRLTDEAAEILKAFGTKDFDKAVATFIEQFDTLKAAYERTPHSWLNEMRAGPSIR